MRQLYASKYQELLYSEKDRLFISEWKPETKHVTKDLYLEELKKLYAHFSDIKPLRYYCDISELQYQSGKEEQEFAANLFKSGFATFCAIVTNKENFPTGVESTITKLEEMTNDFTIKYFFDRNEAMAWLLKSNVATLHA